MTHTSESQGWKQGSDEQLWTDRYRPQTLADIIGQETITDHLKASVESDGGINHLLFSGPAGVGKTTAAKAIAKDLYGDQWRDYFLELNASDERGIDVIRDEVKEFAKTSNGAEGHRIIFLDEADSLTDDSQAALRRTMESHAHNARFILSCNYVGKIIDPIQSRCAVHTFSRVEDDVIVNHVLTIAEREGVELTDDGAEAVAETANGDVRRAVTLLQVAAQTGDVVTADTVYQIGTGIDRKAIQSLLQTARDQGFVTAQRELETIMDNYGVDATAVVNRLYRELSDTETTTISPDNRDDIIQALATADSRIRDGANPQLQLDAVLAEINKLTA